MLEINDLSAGYGKRIVLNDVSLQLHRGQLLTVAGQNGCGKSTLLKCSAGIVTPFKGEIVCDGEPLGVMSRRSRACRVSYLAQGRAVPDMTVRELVLQGRFPHGAYPRRYDENDRRVSEQAMEMMGIAHVAEEPLAKLSGGMRQRAYIAMVLAQDTDYVLLDEPTASLDVSAALELMMLLRRLAEAGRGVVAVMHDLPLAFSFSDGVALMRDGRIAAFGAPDEVASSVKSVMGVELLRGDDGAYLYSYEGYVARER